MEGVLDYLPKVSNHRVASKESETRFISDPMEKYTENSQELHVKIQRLDAGLAATQRKLSQMTICLGGFFVAFIFFALVVFPVVISTQKYDIIALKARAAEQEAALRNIKTTPATRQEESRTGTDGSSEGGVAARVGELRQRNLCEGLEKQFEVIKAELNETSSSLSTAQEQLRNQSRRIGALESLLNESSGSSLIKNQTRRLETLESDLEKHAIETSNVLSNLSMQMDSLEKKVDRAENETKNFNFTVLEVGKSVEALGSKMATDRGEMHTSIVNVSNMASLLERATIFRSCKEYLDKGFTMSGIYKLVVAVTNSMFNVFCDMVTDGGGWLVFQRRQDGSENFFRNWSEYQRGFGNLHGEFWLGNEKLKELTSSGPMRLRVDMEDWAGKRTWAEYASFSVAPSTQQYTLRVSGYSGNAGDALSYNNAQGFSTYDVDHDNRNDQCAMLFHGAFWYNSCHKTNPNGRYGNTKDWSHVVWEDDFRDTPTTPLKVIEMKIR